MMDVSWDDVYVERRCVLLKEGVLIGAADRCMS
jgi:hypothetical protein